ncbi:MAG: 3-deoxy-manno-octulosonate cytidylyltransferase [Gammaproteobacteria bacterium]
MSLEDVGFKVAIPARFDSLRLPGKPLLKIAGKPLLQRVYEQGINSGAEEVIIATDDARIAACARDWGATVCMTSTHCTSGSERIAEAVSALGWGDATIVVNLQGDEPLMPPANIRQVAVNLAAHPAASIASLCTSITRLAEYEDANVVKVVRDAADFALYFSRAPIPWSREWDARAQHLPHCYRHLGLYAYRVSYLKTYAGTTSGAHERIEDLEQLRALWRGDRIHVAQAAEAPGRGVDTPADLAAVEASIISQH